MKNKYALVFSLFSLIGLSTIAQSTVPNGGFENWTTFSYDNLDNYVTEQGTPLFILGAPTTTRDTNSYNGNYAIRMETSISGQDTLFGFFTSGDFETSNGFPYSQSPDSIVGYYKCGVQPGDTAILLLRFSNLGIINHFQVNTFTGAQNNWTRFAFPIGLTTTPDSMFIAVASSNAVNEIGVQHGSWIMLDSIAFTGAGVTQPILNGDFENWTTVSFETPDDWSTTNVGSSSYGVYAATKTTDNQVGTYALRLENIKVFDDTIGFMTNGSFGDSISGGQPFSVVFDTLVGSYKYSPIGIDTAVIVLHFSKNSIPIGIAATSFMAQSTYAPFQVPFVLPQVPDTLRIDLISSINNTTIGSTLFLDDLKLKSIVTTIDKNSIELQSFKMYPNPTENNLFIEFDPLKSELDIQIIDAIGRMYYNTNAQKGETYLNLNLSDLKRGTYYIRMQINGDLIHRSFVKR